METTTKKKKEKRWKERKKKNLTTSAASIEKKKSEIFTVNLTQKRLSSAKNNFHHNENTGVNREQEQLKRELLKGWKRMSGIPLWKRLS